MWQKLKDDLRYRPQQKQGLWVLLFFLILAAAYFRITEQFLQPPPPPGEAQYLTVEDSPVPAVSFQRFYFDPNRVSPELLDSLGVEPVLAARWVKYTGAGGRFRQPEDIYRLWGMDSALAEDLLPYMILPEKAPEPVEAKVGERFPFNPNTLDSSGWYRMGLRPAQISAVLRFRKRGGTFYRAEDLKKMWALDSFLVAELIPWAEIPPEPVKERITVEINTADSVSLTSVPGLGPVFARRILQYRRSLRGYRELSQILEVYGVDSARYEAWLPFLSVEPDNVRPLNVNRATIDELGRHPYIGFPLAREIVDFRQKVRPFGNTEELRQLRLMDARKMAKIAGYIDTGPR